MFFFILLHKSYTKRSTGQALDLSSTTPLTFRVRALSSVNRPSISRPTLPSNYQKVLYFISLEILYQSCKVLCFGNFLKNVVLKNLTNFIVTQRKMLLHQIIRPIQGSNSQCTVSKTNNLYQ